MTAHDDLERRITDYYATEAPPRAPDWVLRSVLATTEVAPQRRPLIRVPWRLPKMNGYARLAIAAVAVLAVGAIGLFVLRPAPSPGVGGVNSPAASASAGGASPVDGVWTSTFTRQELEDSPFLYDAGEVNDQNWGDFTMTLEDGRVEYVQRNDIDGYTTAGTFSVEGDIVTFRYETGGNANETFRMRWSLFQDTLTFERVPAGLAPTPYVLKPWTKSP